MKEITQTMSSLELVKLINTIRKEEGNTSELRHDHFMDKIVKVLGEDNPNFRGIYLDSMNREKPCYYLPKRESNLMVISESYKVQAAVYDKMIELEQENTKLLKQQVELLKLQASIAKYKTTIEKATTDIIKHQTTRKVLEAKTTKLLSQGAKEIPNNIGEYLAYNATSGLLIWIKKSSKYSNVAVGSIAGSLNADGYLQIMFEKNNYMAHRIAWFIKTGKQPPINIDHKDTIKTNNMWTNLREATKSQNQHNKGKQKNNTSGYKGVTFNIAADKWKAQIRIKGKRVHLGYFDTVEKAYLAYCTSSEELHQEFSRIF